MYVLDTNILSERLKEHCAPVLARRMRFQPANALFTSAICVMELRYGATRKDDGGVLWRRIESAVLPRVQIVDLGEEEAILAGDLRSYLERRGQPIQTEDLLIAATALARGFVVVTHNQAHFSRIPNLRVEDWIA